MKEITAAEFDNEVLNAEKVILDFYSTECPPCEALASKFEDLSRLYGKDVKFLKIFRQQNRDLAEQLDSEFDVIILGAGPGGLAAGLYLCQSKINTVLIDHALSGGNVATTHQVSNYPGFTEPQPGYLLSHNMSEQTKLCGAVYKVAVDITIVDFEKKEVIIDEYEIVRAKRIIIATGTTSNLTGANGEKELRARASPTAPSVTRNIVMIKR